MATMQMRNTVSRPCLSSRRSTVRAYAAASGKTQSGADPRTTQGVQEYLRSLPGWGTKSGPFEDVWDPAGLSNSATLADVRRWRESELTHGRVSMLAALGFIVGEQLEDFPAFFNFDGHIQGQAIHQFDQVQQGFWEPLLIAIGLAESYRVSIGWAPPAGGDGFNALRADYENGNLGFDPLNLKPNNAEELWTLQTKEINNGRLAMIAIAGFVLQEVAEPGVKIFDHLFVDIKNDAVAELNGVKKVL